MIINNILGWDYEIEPHPYPHPNEVKSLMPSDLATHTLRDVTPPMPCRFASFRAALRHLSEHRHLHESIPPYRLYHTKFGDWVVCDFDYRNVGYGICAYEWGQGYFAAIIKL